jgi:hypothetical protein
MNCEEALDALAHDDEEAAQRAREHMRTCETCKVLVGALESYHQAEKEPEPAADATKVRENVKARMRELAREDRPANVVKFPVRQVALAATFLVAIGASFLGGRATAPTLRGGDGPSLDSPVVALRRDAHEVIKSSLTTPEEKKAAQELLEKIGP